MKCACEANGGCGGEQVHTVTCPTEMKWDPHRCSCVGLCEETEASRKHLHKEETPSVTLPVLVGCLLGEFVLVVVVGLCCCRCCGRKSATDPGDSSVFTHNTATQRLSSLRHRLSSLGGGGVNSCGRSEGGVREEGSVSLLQDVKDNECDDSDVTHMEIPP